MPVVEGSNAVTMTCVVVGPSVGISTTVTRDVTSEVVWCCTAVDVFIAVTVASDTRIDVSVGGLACSELVTTFVISSVDTEVDAATACVDKLELISVVNETEGVGGEVVYDVE